MPSPSRLSPQLWILVLVVCLTLIALFQLGPSRDKALVRIKHWGRCRRLDSSFVAAVKPSKTDWAFQALTLSIAMQGPTDTHKLTLTGPQDLELHVLPVGGVVQRLCVRDKAGDRRDVALGFDTLTPYQVIRLKNRVVRVLEWGFCGLPAKA